MGYIILWLGFLISCLLGLAAVAAFTARSKKIKRVRLQSMSFALFILSLDIVATILAYILWDERIEPAWLLPYTLGQVVCFAVGAFLIIRRGFGKKGQSIAAKEWAAGTLALAALISLLFTVGVFRMMDMSLRIHQANYRSRVMVQVMNAWPSKPPEALNPMPLLDEASQMLAGSPLLGPYTPQTGFPPDWSREVIKADFDPASPEVASYLTEKAAVFDLLARAANRPEMHFDLDLRDLAAAPIPNFSSLRFFAAVLTARAKQNAQAGRTHAALEDLDVLRRLGEHQFSLPLLLSSIIGTITEEFRSAGLEYVLAQSAETDVIEIDSPISPAKPMTPVMEKTIALDGLVFVQALANTDVELGKKEPGGWLFELGEMGKYALPFWRVFLFPDDVASVIDIHARLGEAYGMPYPQGVERIEEVREAAYDEFSGFTAKMSYMDHTRYYVRWKMTEARRALMDVALAAAAHRAVTGVWPEKPEDLVPEYLVAIPADPFGNGPLQMMKINGGLDLFSTGPTRDYADNLPKGPIHFYLGKEAYEENRVKPAIEKRKAEAESKAKSKK